MGEDFRGTSVFFAFAFWFICYLKKTEARTVKKRNVYNTLITVYIHKCKIQKWKKEKQPYLFNSSDFTSFFHALKFLFFSSLLLLLLDLPSPLLGQGEGSWCAYVHSDTYTHTNLRDRCKCQLLLLYGVLVGRESTGLTNRSSGCYERIWNLQKRNKAGKAQGTQRTRR